MRLMDECHSHAADSLDADCHRGAAELRRDGTTIHSDVEISYVDAILGTTTKVSRAPASMTACPRSHVSPLCQRHTN